MTRAYAALAALLVAGLAAVAMLLLTRSENAEVPTTAAPVGGMFRIVARAVDVGPIDPALEYTAASSTIVRPTCASLSEVAAGRPRLSDGRTTYTYALRDGFRFSDGKPVRASAFERAIDRVLAPELQSPWAPYLSDLAGVTARGNTLVLRLDRPVPDFVARASVLCAVPTTLPVDPEGVGAFPAAGPYYVAEYHPAERIVLRRNQFYGGTRPHHVDGFDIDLRASSFDEVLDRVERGDADWGYAMPAAYLEPGRRLVAKHGVNRSRFFVRPGRLFRGLALNSSRTLFRENPRLRRAVNLAIDRRALRRSGGGWLESRLTDQYLPHTMRGYRDAHIYPLDGPDLRRARELARGHTRGGKAVLYTVESPQMAAFAQSVRQDLAEIGLDVEVKAFSLPEYFGRLGATGPYDIGFAPWLADFDDPYSMLNVLLDGQFVGRTNWARFDSPAYNRLLRDAARLEGAARYRAYGELDVRLAREGAPLVAVDVVNELNLVSKRVGCVTPSFDLTAVCLRR